jgi:hypothetical protein
MRRKLKNMEERVPFPEKQALNQAESIKIRCKFSNKMQKYTPAVRIIK